jgi:hypothetical protein
MAKCKVAHIGVFFDGTGNNMCRDRDTKPSNIARLHELYKKGKIPEWSDVSCDYYADKIYKIGVGTEGTLDEMLGGGAGNGGAKRINEAIDTLVGLLTEKGKGGTYSIKNGFNRTRIIDVFGFSRGAAEARDFINVFHRKNVKYKLKNIRFNFVGLYDTVGSFGAAGNDIDYKLLEREAIKADYSNVPEILKPLIKASVSLANAIPELEAYNFSIVQRPGMKVVHFIASDEFRYNFPLTRIDGSGGTEIMYGGAHSDIGGGYSKTEQEKHKLDKVPRTRENIPMIQKRFHSHNPGIAITTHPRSGKVMSEVFYRPVSNDIEFVTLHRMYKEAISHKVPFLPMPTKEYLGMMYSLPPSMKEYYLYAKGNPSNVMSFENMPNLRLKNFHRSAYDQLDVYYSRSYNDATELAKSPMRYSKDNTKPERKVFQNRPSKAVSPWNEK